VKRQPMALVLAGLGVLAGAAALSAATEGDGTIRACQHVRHGLIRVIPVTGSCKKGEKPISWNQLGPKGDKGDKGDPGDPGPQGPKGDPGPPGTGLTSIAGLAGLACTTSEGAQGRVEVDTTATDLITLTCETGVTPPPAAAGLVINEVDYDQVGADTAGFVEIRNAGDAAATLDGLAIVLVNGGDGAEYGRAALSGTIAAGGHVAVDVDLQNGAPDGVALIDTASGNLLDALSYEGAITSAQIGTLTYSLVEGTPLDAAVADSNTVDGSLIRNPDGADTNDAAADWAFTTTVTRSAPNVLTP